LTPAAVTIVGVDNWRGVVAMVRALAGDCQGRFDEGQGGAFGCWFALAINAISDDELDELD